MCEALETLATHLIAYRKHVTGSESAAESTTGGSKRHENYDGCPLSAADVDASIATVAKYSRNFLPCFFNVFGSPVSPGLRQTVANTITVFLEITSSEVLFVPIFLSCCVANELSEQLVNTFFKNVIQKLLEAITTAASTPTGGDSQAKEKEAAAATSRYFNFAWSLEFERLLDTH